VPRRHHGQPGEPVGVVITAGDSFKPAREPIARFRELGGEFPGDFVANFVAAPADAGAERDKNVFRTRAELHAHAPQRFLGDAFESSAPPSVDRGDSAGSIVGQKNGDAIGSLNGEQETWFASQECVALQWIRMSFLVPRDQVNDIRMNLTQCHHAHFARADRFRESSAVFSHILARMPIGEAEIQYWFVFFVCARRAKLADSTQTRAEAMNEPLQLRQARGLEDAKIVDAANLPIWIMP